MSAKAHSSSPRKMSPPPRLLRLTPLNLRKLSKAATLMLFRLLAWASTEGRPIVVDVMVVVVVDAALYERPSFTASLVTSKDVPEAEEDGIITWLGKDMPPLVVLDPAKEEPTSAEGLKSGCATTPGCRGGRIEEPAKGSAAEIDGRLVVAEVESLWPDMFCGRCC